MKPIINVGILSYGMSGMVYHAPILHANPKYSIKKILQRTRSDANERYPYLEVVHTIEEILQDSQIDLIIVNTPDHTHYELARAALEAEKHVVVEKPFVQKLDDGLTLIELAKQKGKILSVFQNRRYEGDFLTIREIIDKKLLGRLVEYEAHFDRYRNFIRDTWKEKPENNTGILYNLGSHLIDQALILFGMPEAVNADIRMQRTGAQVDDSFDLSLLYADLKVRLKASYLVREPGPRFILNGTEGSFVKYGVDPQEEALKNGHLPDEPEWGREQEINWGILNTNLNGLHYSGKIETLPGCYHEYYNNIYDAIVHNKTLAVKAQESLNGIHIIHAAYESSREGKTIGIQE
jgi:scyllo-inositol 2-dehydrogenase (NADP+)